MQRDRLLWLPELQAGFYPVKPCPNTYAGDYWNRYRLMDETLCGQQLTALRVDLVRRYYSGPVVDVGIGGGRFVRECPDAMGFDVNPFAIEHLREAGKFANPYATESPALTFWDSLEHIEDPSTLLAMASGWVFVSIPIFDDAADVIRSKHYRKDEHFWYFTASGFERFMLARGFGLCEANLMEQQAGREQIATFVFRRMAGP